MKIYIYLLIFPFLVVCSCKSSSFLTQRYTTYKHSHTKHTSTTVAVKENKAPYQKVELTTPLDTEQETSFLTASSVSRKSTDIKKENASVFPKRLIRPLTLFSNKIVTESHTLQQKQETHQISGKKTVSEKMHHAMGLLDTVFKIILFSIILAVLVAIIIIIILT